MQRGGKHKQAQFAICYAPFNWRTVIMNLETELNKLLLVLSLYMLSKENNAVSKMCLFHFKHYTYSIYVNTAYWSCEGDRVDKVIGESKHR